MEILWIWWSAELDDQSQKGDSLGFVISKLQFGGRVILGRAVVGLSIELGVGIGSDRASSALLSSSKESALEAVGEGRPLIS